MFHSNYFSRYFMYLIITPIKIGIFLGSAVCIYCLCKEKYWIVKGVLPLVDGRHLKSKRPANLFLPLLQCSPVLCYRGQMFIIVNYSWSLAWTKFFFWIWASLFAGQFQNGVRTPQKKFYRPINDSLLAMSILGFFTL